MNLDAIITWVLENKEIIGLSAVIATSLGAIYQPTRDFLKALPHAIWTLVKLTFQFVWFVIWPLRKLITWAYEKFLSQHVDKLLEKISDYIDKKEAVKEKLRDNKNTIEVIDL